MIKIGHMNGSVTDVAEKALKIAKIAEQDVTVSFNGAPVTAGPDESVDEIVTNWSHIRRAIQRGIVRYNG